MPRLQAELRRPSVALGALGVALALLAPVLPGVRNSTLTILAGVCATAVAALGLDVLIGRAGQLSLAQASFVGVGAFATIQAGGRGAPWPLAMLCGIAATALVSTIAGLPSLRIRGLQIAIVTLAMQLAAKNFVYPDDRLTGAGLTLDRPALLGSPTRLFYFGLACVAVVLLVRRRIGVTRAGRSLLAVRDIEARATAFGIEPGRTKLFAYTMAGLLTGVAGVLTAFKESPGAISDTGPFELLQSLLLVGVVVVGGAGSGGGIVLAALLLNGVPQIFTGTGPGCTVDLRRAARRRRRAPAHGYRRPRLPTRPARPAAQPGTSRPTAPPGAQRRRGGRGGTAPRRASWSVVARAGPGVARSHRRDGAVRRCDGTRPRHPRGAQRRSRRAHRRQRRRKVDLLQRCVGFRSYDRVDPLRGIELLRQPGSKRTPFGLARTFQDMGLVRAETVRENMLLAQGWLARYPMTAGILALGVTISAERDLRRRGDIALELFGLDHLADERLGDLPYGTMRIAEIAAAVAAGPDLLLLDEATAGLGPEESQALGDRFLSLRDDLGLTLVVIEHHVPLIARVCDYCYCLESGALIASGTPAEVTAEPRVVESFLGRSAAATGGGRKK